MRENEEIVTIQNRSERNRVDRENMIQECKNPIAADDFHGFLHWNCEGTEQLQKMICNCCGRELKRCGARYEDHLHIVKNWGYLSDQDGTAEEMDICPDCLANWERTFAIAPKKYRVTELL